MYQVAYRARGFTLIEVLVVVAIIALLVSVLMPAMKLAKDQTKATVCLNNLKQQGIGFAAYASDFKSTLPWAGGFKYYMAQGLQEVGISANRKNWTLTGNGCLFPKYIGKTIDIFYCPSNTKNVPDPPLRGTVSPAPGESYPDDPPGINGQGKFAFLCRYKYWSKNFSKPKDRYRDGGDPGWYPYSGYGYGLPLMAGKWPKIGGKTPYPRESMTTVEIKRDANNKQYALETPSQFLSYMEDPVPWPESLGLSFFGPCPKSTRGVGHIQALLADCYFGGISGFHINGWNVLFSDFHAKRVADPGRKLQEGTGGGKGAYDHYNPRPWMAWDYFSKHP